MPKMVPMVNRTAKRGGLRNASTQPYSNTALHHPSIWHMTQLCENSV